MANLTESATYDAGVYQIETTDPVLGGPSGIANAPLKNLANRTKYLKSRVDTLESAGSAPLNSPAFTGSPTGPTPASGDNDTSLATTAFVQQTVGGVLIKSVAGSANVTLTANECGNAILILTGVLTGNISVILEASPTRSWLVRNLTTGSFTVTVKTAAGSGVLVAQGRVSVVYSDGTNINAAAFAGSGTNSDITSLTALSALTVTSNAPEITLVESDAGFTARIVVDGSTLHFRNTGGGDLMNVDQYGNFLAAANVSAYSDERLKTNWRDLPAEFVAQLAGVKTGIYDRTDMDLTQVGVSAQSLQRLLPDAVPTGDDGFLSVTYGNAALASCVMLAREIVSLRAELDALKGASNGG